jgi:hypothetical protein
MPWSMEPQSRPTTNPAKQHWYFRHTLASIAEFKKLGRGVAKEISSIRDVTAPKDERGLYPNRYDLKGSGKGGFVVGAGGLQRAHDAAFPDAEELARRIQAQTSINTMIPREKP